jgi:hypothetical protein
VTFPPVSPQVMQSAQVFTGASFAAFLLVGFLPPRVQWLRWAILAIYLAGAAGFVAYAFIF